MGEMLKKRSEIEDQYKWNLEDMIASAAEEKAMEKQAEENLPSFEAFAGTLGQSAVRLAEYLATHDREEELLSRLMAYAQQKSDEDTADAESQAMVSRVQSLFLKFFEKTAFAEPEILDIPAEKMKEFLASSELSLYKKNLERLLKKKAHMLSKEEETLLAASVSMAQSPSAIFTLFNNADLTFEPVTDADGNELPVSHGRFGLLMENSDRNVRRAAFQSYYKSYGQFANTAAAMFEGNVKQACFYAKARKYPSTRAYYLSENEVPESVYDNLLAAVHKHLNLLHRYISIRKRALDVDKVHMYDLYAPMVPDFKKSYPYEEAKAMVLEALKPLGTEYTDIVKEGFESRWIDVYENQGKRSGGYSNCVYGVHPYVLLSYDHTLHSALTLAHEMGHSLHSWYSNENQPYPYAGYTIFVAEVASTVNEALLLNDRIKKAESHEEKVFLLSQFLERFRQIIYRQTMFAEFEFLAHKKAWDGIPLTKAELCAMYHDLNARYFGDDAFIDPEIDFEWERIPHFYSPFYVYQYSTGFAAAMAISGRILAGDEKTLKGYFEFLKGGSSGTPIELLKLCGLDMETPQAVEEALAVFEGLLDEFERESGL